MSKPFVITEITVISIIKLMSDGSVESKSFSPRKKKVQPKGFKKAMDTKVEEMEQEVLL